MDVLVQLLLGFVEAAAAGEDDTGASQKRAFSVAKTGRSTGKTRQFIHAVVNDCRRIQMIAETKRHRRVVPQHLGPDALSRDHVIKELPLNFCIARSIALAQMRHDDVDSWLCVGDGDVRCIVGIKDWFFNDEDAPISGATAQQMLRTLQYEVPSQV